MTSHSGQTWNSLTGLAGAGEMYQPWIHALADGRIVCAGHFGADDPIGEGREHPNFVNLHTFRLKVQQRTRGSKIQITRDYDPELRKWRNSYSLVLTEAGKPLAGKPLEFQPCQSPQLEFYAFAPMQAERKP